MPTLPHVSLPRQVYADAALVLRAALTGDRDRVVATFDSVVDRAGLAAVYDVAWCLAATMVGGDVPRGPWTLDFPGIDEAGYDARWVARFVVRVRQRGRLDRRGAVRRGRRGRLPARLPAHPRRFGGRHAAPPRCMGRALPPLIVELPPLIMALAG